jgi:hypothetical protein
MNCACFGGKPHVSGILDAIWHDDLLHRQEEAIFLKDFLAAKITERGQLGNKRSFVLNIDAGWGHGKSYFLSKFEETLTADGFVVARINAWSDDHADDPLIAVMAGIDASIKNNTDVKKSAGRPLGKLAQIGGQVVAAGAKGLIKQAAKKYLGDDTLEDLSEIIGSASVDAVGSAETEIGTKLSELYDAEGKALLENFSRAKKSIEEFKKQLGKVLESFKSKSKLPLFVLVDELDRCRPTYAVALLERVKHLFEVDDVVFVLATDTSQLRHSIRALYGPEFDAGRYLLRFFDQTYRFEEPAIHDFVAAQFVGIDEKKLYGSPKLTPAEFSSQVFSAFGLSLRDIEQCIDVLKNCVTVWPHKSPLVLLVLLPLVIGQQQRIVPSFSAGFRSELEGSLHRSVDQWLVDFDVWERHIAQKKIFDGWKAFEMLARVARSETLPRIINSDASNDADDRLAAKVFADELAQRFPQGYLSNNPPVSVIREYPRLVRSVGRLA